MYIPTSVIVLACIALYLLLAFFVHTWYEFGGTRAEPSCCTACSCCRSIFS